MSTTPLPAHKTKHLETLHYPIPNTPHILTLTQSQSQSPPSSSSSSSSSSASTGTTLWLSSQLLTYHLLTLFPRHNRNHRPRGHGRAIDLGAGTGLTSHILSYLGFRVCATDLAQITGTILSENVSRNADLLAGIAGASPISVRALDWAAPLPSPSSLWDGGDGGDGGEEGEEGGEEEVKVIVTADTFYKQDLVRPLILTIKALCIASARCARGRSGKERKKFPLVLVAVEVRDRGLLQSALEAAAREGFECRRVGDGRVKRGLEAAGVRWAREEWDGGEVWRWGFKGV